MAEESYGYVVLDRGGAVVLYIHFAVPEKDYASPHVFMAVIFAPIPLGEARREVLIHADDLEKQLINFTNRNRFINRNMRPICALGS